MKRKIDVLFIQGNGAPIIYQNLAKDYSCIEPPIWSALLAQHVRAKGFSVNILDCEALRLTIEESIDRIKYINPRLAVFVVYGQQPSASTQNMVIVANLANRLKLICPEIKILFVGAHPSAVARETIDHTDADFVCQGEGPHTITALLQTDLESEYQLKKVPGLWYKNSFFTKFTPSAPIILQEELETELPGMAWDLLPMEKYRTSNWHALSNNNKKQPFASLYTSLGCPMKCSFCMINSPFGNNNVENSFGGPSFRFWNPDFVIKEFDKIAKMGIRNVKIADEMFVLYKKHFMEICNKIIEREYNFNIWAYARIDTVKENYLETLKKAGVNWLALGIEAGDAVVRKDVIKGKFTEINIRELVKKIQEHGINVIGNYIFGLPEDNLQTMRETLDLAKELNCEFSNFYSCMFYPGSALYLDALKNDLDLPPSYAAYSQHSYECFPAHTKFISNKEVLRFRDNAFLEYFRGSDYLEMVKKKFGRDAHDGILDMTTHKLKRKLLGD